MLGDTPIDADGWFRVRVVGLDNEVQVIGQFKADGQLGGAALETVPTMSTDGNSTPFACASDTRHYTGHLSADGASAVSATAPATSPAAKAAGRSTTRLDAQGRVATFARTPAVPAASVVPRVPAMAATGPARDSLLGTYTGTTSQGQPVRFQVQVTFDGADTVITNFEAPEDMTCRRTGQPLHAGLVGQQAVLRGDGTFGMVQLGIGGTLKVKGAQNADGSFSGRSWQVVPALVLKQPRDAQRCDGAAVTWTAVRTGD